MLSPEQEIQYFPYPNQKLFGFIVLRHVQDERTNKYWNLCIQRIRTHYPLARIMMIDDNSNRDYLVAEFEYKNVFVVQSEFPKRGELLPFYYFLKHKPFEYAVILHDSVFMYSKLNILQFIQENVPFVPMWSFTLSWDMESQKKKAKTLLDQLNVNLQTAVPNFDTEIYLLSNHLVRNKNILPGRQIFNSGCFGCMCLIQYSYLQQISLQYPKLFPLLLQSITCRLDRCMLERILYFILWDKLPMSIKLNPKYISILGNIHKYCKWGYSFEEFTNDILTNPSVIRPIVKVWSGR